MADETMAQDNPFVRSLEDWKSRTPLLCRLVAQTTVVAYVVSWLVPLKALFECIPFKVLSKLQFYRLLLSPLGGNSLLGTLFACLTIGDGVGPRLERSSGSLSFAALWALAVLGVNCAFVALCYVLAAGGTLEAALLSSSGIWGPLFCLVAVECLSAPETTRKLFFLPVDVPRLYYPLVLCGLFMLLAGLKLDLALGLAIGYLEHFGYLRSLRPSLALISRLEGHSALAWLVNADPAYVTGRAALGAAAWVPLTPADADWADAGQQSSTGGPRSLSGMFEAFRAGTQNAGLTSASSNAPRQRFPDSGGRVLGSTPSHDASDGTNAGGDVAGRPGSPARTTAAANRATILAAVEARSANKATMV